MNFKEHINYFKKTDTLKFVGIALAVLGIVLFFFGWGYISYILMSVSIPCGIALIVVGSVGRSNDGDIDTFIKNSMDGLDIRLEEDPAYVKRIVKHMPKEIISGYEYEDGFMLKKQKSGKVCSSQYSQAVLRFLSDGLYLSKRTVSLISPDVSNTLHEIPYGIIKNASIVREQKRIAFNKNSFMVKDVRLLIEYGEGLTLSTPINDDIKSDELAEKINKLAKEHQSI